MRDDVTFEARLADALGRYAELAPAMDDTAVARQAIETGGARRPFGWLRSMPAGRARLRVAYLLVVLGLLLAAILVALTAGAFRIDPLRPLARNGAIAFTVQGNNHEAPVTHLVGADGTADHAIDVGRCPVWSRDGRVMAELSYEGSAYLVVRDAAGAPTHKVLLVDTPSTSVSLALSPDGTRVAWFKPASPGDGFDLWVAPVAGGAAARIVPGANEGDAFYASPLWSPDGGRVAFGTYAADPVTGERHRSAISTVNADGSDRRRLTARPGLLEDAMSWSPDGRFLAYLGLPDPLPNPSSSASPAPQADPARDVFVIGADGIGDRNLTSSPALEHQPEWSPDGAYLAFDTSVDGEAHRLTTVHMNGPTPVGPPVLGPESAWFVWSPDGTELLWLEATTLGPETFRSTVHAIDPSFREPPTTVQAVDGLIVCTPSWQRLEP